MANYNDVLFIANHAFNDLNGKFNIDVFTDIITVTIDNDKKYLNPILECGARSLNGAIWGAILNIFTDYIGYYDLLSTNAVNSNQLKKALNAVSGLNFADVVAPCVTYYMQERAERNAENV